MYDGFIRVAAVTPGVKTADVSNNAKEIIKRAKEAGIKGAKVIVFPELCLTGAGCGDLFCNSLLLEESKAQLFKIAKALKSLDAIVFVGLPLADHGSIYNVVAALSGGKVLGFVPKKRIGHDSHTQGRPFSNGNERTKKIFVCDSMPELAIGVEIGEDSLLADDPATDLCMNGATVIAVPSAMPESVTSRLSRRINLLSGSGRFHAAFVYAGASHSESTTDTVCGGARLIVEDGELLGEGELYTDGMLLTEIDVQALRQQRLSDSLFKSVEEGVEIISFDLDIEPALTDRIYSPLPFVPEEAERCNEYCRDVFDIQTHALVQRMRHIGASRLIVGVSGGLDSTLALLVCAAVMDRLGRPRKDILAITMPGFGTTDRTYDNAVELIKHIGAEFREIPIKDAVLVHFKDIGHEPDNHDTAYENAQARERTQILMDVGNMENGIVVGTGDLSELALGWATYNGDHMSMYAVNGAVTKTLIRFIIKFYIETYVSDDEAFAATLLDVVDTPVSPELIPSDTGTIVQKTEEKVGPYELSDFFLYYSLGYGFGPKKVFRLACNAFEGIYEKQVVVKWLGVFYQRFFSQQYKRSCLPDGPGIGLIGVSPRGSLSMPSDASVALWKSEIQELIR